MHPAGNHYGAGWKRTLAEQMLLKRPVSHTPTIRALWKRERGSAPGSYGSISSGYRENPGLTRKPLRSHDDRRGAVSWAAKNSARHSAKGSYCRKWCFAG